MVGHDGPVRSEWSFYPIFILARIPTTSPASRASSLKLKPSTPTSFSSVAILSICHDPEAGQADLAAVRVSGKGQMGSGRYTREPHRIMRKQPL
jgi:hypothetical protein